MRKTLLPAFASLLVVSCVIFQISCDKKVGKKPVPVPVPVNICDSATYAIKINKLIQANCAIPDCHVAGFPSGDLTTFDGVKSKVDNGSFKRKVFDTPDNPMPPLSNGGMLPSDKLQLIKCWLDKGAKND